MAARFSYTKMLTYVIAWLLGIVWVLPFAGIFMASVRPLSEIVYGWWNVDRFTVTLQNYFNAWTNSDAPLSKGIPNSFLVAVPSTVIPIFIGALAAYAFMRFKFPLKNTLFVLTLFLIMIPLQMVIIPDFLIMFTLGLWNTPISLIILHTAFGLPWIILFLTNFFGALPKEVIDSARVDGASEFRIFFNVVLPMSLPALASIFAIQFLWVWNDFFIALVMTISPDSMVATRMLPILKGRIQVDWGLVSAGSVMTMLVPILVYALLSKYFVKGIVAGAVKG